MLVRVHRQALAARRGAELVELCLTAPFLVFLALITTDFGRVIYFTQTVENCARNGAIWASDPDSVTDSPYATLQAAGQADASNLSTAPTLASASGTDASGNPYVDVTATYTFRSIVSNYTAYGGSIPISRTVRMRVIPMAPN